jgi:IMP dehydrogenase/GMP reductase
MIEHKKIKGLSFDDILIPPVYSDIRSRNDVDTSTNIGGLQLKIPFIASPMDTVCESNMAIALGRLGGLGIIHRFMSPEEQVEHCNRVADAGCYVVPAIGVGQEERARFSYLINNCKKIDMISIDVANGHSILMQEMVEFVKRISPAIKIMAGNIATFHAYEFMIGLGVDAVRVGIGGGCFVADTKVSTLNGLKNIQDVEIGNLVYTHTGELREVIDILQFDRNEEIISINDISCTKNHEFYVVNISDADKITEDNIHEYAFWMHAEDLEPERHMLIKLD